MKHEPDKEFEKNLLQFIQLLKKIMAGGPRGGNMPDMGSALKGQGVNINLFLFSFFPMTPEEFDEIEDLYDQYLQEDEKKESGELTPDLTDSDREFLSRNGIRY